MAGFECASEHERSSISIGGIEDSQALRGFRARVCTDAIELIKARTDLRALLRSVLLFWQGLLFISFPTGKPTMRWLAPQLPRANCAIGESLISEIETKE